MYTALKYPKRTIWLGRVFGVGQKRYADLVLKWIIIEYGPCTQLFQRARNGAQLRIQLRSDAMSLARHRTHFSVPPKKFVASVSPATATKTK